MNTVEQVAGYTGNFPFYDGSKKPPLEAGTGFAALLSQRESPAEVAAKCDINHKESEKDDVYWEDFQSITYNRWGTVCEMKPFMTRSVNLVI